MPAARNAGPGRRERDAGGGCRWPRLCNHGKRQHRLVRVTLVAAPLPTAFAFGTIDSVWHTYLLVVNARQQIAPWSIVERRRACEADPVSHHLSAGCLSHQLLTETKRFRHREDRRCPGIAFAKLGAILLNRSS